MQHKRLIVSWTVVCLVISLATLYAASAYPYIKHIKATPVAIQGNVVTIKGTADIYFTDRAWHDIKYKNDSFAGFDEYWHSQIGQKYCYMGVSVRLEYIDWTLQRHYADHDHLGFIMKVRVLSY